MDTLGDHRRGCAPVAVWWGRVTVLVVMAVVGLAGCSLSPHSTLSAASLEAKIAAELARTYNIAPPKVNCPASVPVTPGAHFTCIATLDGQPLRVLGTVTDSRGHVQVHPASAVVVKSAAEAEISQSLSKRVGSPVHVSCPLPGLLVASPGHTFGCTAEIAGVERHVAVTVVNPAGDLRYRVLPYQPPRTG
jgi:hypothetical protein